MVNNLSLCGERLEHYAKIIVPYVVGLLVVFIGYMISGFHGRHYPASELHILFVDIWIGATLGTFCLIMAGSLISIAMRQTRQGYVDYLKKKKQEADNPALKTPWYQVYFALPISIGLLYSILALIGWAVWQPCLLYLGWFGTAGSIGAALAFATLLGRLQIWRQTHIQTSTTT